MGFPKDFVWGAAAASYQVEGAAYEGGKGMSVWDMYCLKEGAIYEGHTGDQACDHYHRYKEDVALMREVGLKAYRLSFSWPRILPDGIGKVNPEGIAFYRNLLQELRDNGITPYITLYHWDMPLALYQRGGWMNPDSPDWFEEYAKVVAENFSDLAEHFITFNEPQCFIGLGYVTGEHAPGLNMSLAETVPMSHHVLVAHGKAVQALRKYGKQKLVIGYAPTCTFAYPSTDAAEDIEAARQMNFNAKPQPDNWAWNVTWWSDPVYLGHYPKDGLALYEKYLPEGWQEDMKTIFQPLDFCAQNIYNGQEVNAKGIVKRYEGFPKTALQWPITPDALKWGAKFLYERYQLPVLITENGVSCHDVIALDGKVHDPDRIDFINRYLRKLREACDEGVPVMGYFLWSIIDNFEWAHGYHERLGLIYVDYPTQKRIIKDSGYWYRKVMETNGECL